MDVIFKIIKSECIKKDSPILLISPELAEELKDTMENKDTINFNYDFGDM